MNTHRIIHGCAIGALLLSVGEIEALAGGPIVRMTPPSESDSQYGRRGDQDEDKPSNTGAIALTGEIRYGRREGLSVGGISVRMGANTGIFPGTDSERLPSPSSLQGKHATVLGVWDGYGSVEARLILIQEARLSSPERGELKAGMVPSSSDPDVGEMTEGAPH